MPNLPAGIAFLQYAYDSTFFMEGSVEEVENLSTQLDIFSECSGLQSTMPSQCLSGLGYSQSLRPMLFGLGDANKYITHVLPGVALDGGAN